jgi:Tfp pilus assembly protein PilF
MLGQANVLYSNGEYAQSMSILKEIIRQSPQSYEAWLSVASIFQETGDLVKAQRALFVAASLNGKDASLWLRLAQQSMFVTALAFGYSIHL